MHYYNKLQDLIGNTPLLKLNGFGQWKGANLFAKLELLNPLGSVKDRTGAWMIRGAERSGLLKPDTTIVEATAGNTGLGIAFSALEKGYRVIFVVPEKFSQEKQALMRALGAEIINTPRAGGMLGAAKKAEEIVKSIGNAISLRQFENLSNPLAHYESTGPEIYRDLDGDISYFVMGAGSGGTFSGVARYLKEQNPNIKAVLVDPIGSTLGGGEHGDYEIEGIGNDFVAKTMDLSLVDEVIKVSDNDAFKTCRELARKEGVVAGSSSGASLYGALELLNRGVEGNVVALLPDRGDRYLSKHLFG